MLDKQFCLQSTMLIQHFDGQSPRILSGIFTAAATMFKQAASLLTNIARLRRAILFIKQKLFLRKVSLPESQSIIRWCDRHAGKFELFNVCLNFLRIRKIFLLKRKIKTDRRSITAESGLKRKAKSKSNNLTTRRTLQGIH